LIYLTLLITYALTDIICSVFYSHTGASANVVIKGCRYE